MDRRSAARGGAGCRRSPCNESCAGRWAILSSLRQSEGALMVQFAEHDAGAETIEATLSYFVDTEAMPVTLVGKPGASDLRTGGGKAEPRRVVLRNGRLHADQFVLEHAGFRFVHHSTEVVAFFDAD